MCIFLFLLGSFSFFKAKKEPIQGYKLDAEEEYRLLNIVFEKIEQSDDSLIQRILKNRNPHKKTLDEKVKK